MRLDERQSYFLPATIKIPGTVRRKRYKSLETDIRSSVMVIVHVHDVANIWIEGEMIGSIRWLEKIIDVEDRGDAIGVIVAHERVSIRDARGVIQCDDRRSTMARCKQAGWNHHQQPHDGRTC